MYVPSQQTASGLLMYCFLVAQLLDGKQKLQYSFTVTRLTTSNSSSVCATGTVYTATNDNSPIIHVGCGYGNYKALRNGNTNILAIWPDWSPPVVSAAPTLGYTAATDRAGESAMYATPTPGQVFDPPTEAVCKFFISASYCHQSSQETRGTQIDIRGDIQFHESHRCNSWWRCTGLHHLTLHLEKETRPTRKTRKSSSSHSLPPSISRQWYLPARMTT